MDLRKCPECGRPILGRQDKKFCSDHCRHTSNNRRNNFTNNYMRHINVILRRNRTVLSELVPAETAKVSRTKLQERGFQFEFCTSVESGKKKPIFYCYEYGYQELDKDMFHLVKKAE